MARKREEVKKKIEEQSKKKEPANAWKFAYEKPPVEKEFETVPLTKYAKQVRQSKLPVLAPKETRWEFANAKPPAIIPRQAEIVDYTPPQFETVPLTKYAKQVRQSKLPVSAQRYKETTKQVSKESSKIQQNLNNLLKKETTFKANPNDFILQPFRRLTKLVNDTPNWVKNTPQFKQIVKEIGNEIKRIQSEALNKNVSKDLIELNKNIDKLENLLKSPQFKANVQVVSKKKKNVSTQETAKPKQNKKKKSGK
jgi:hypothetical protein